MTTAATGRVSDAGILLYFYLFIPGFRLLVSLRTRPSANGRPATGSKQGNNDHAERQGGSIIAGRSDE